MSALSSTLTQAIIIITAPLASYYSPASIAKLQTELKAFLFDHYVSTWNPAQPLSGTGRRCLTLCAAAPPRPIYNACASARVQWSHWFALLSKEEFDLFVDPGCVSMRPVDSAERVILWTPAQEARARDAASFAQLLQQEDQAMEQEVFALIDDELRCPEYLTPILDRFPDVPSKPQRSSSPVSTTSAHSRSSSFSSHSSGSSSSGASFSSIESTDSASSQARRERAQPTRVFIDHEKKEVTPYDGGKTTVLTGGVMLGGKPTAKPAHKRTPSSATPTGRAGRF